MVKDQIGNVLNCSEDVLLHGVNCRGAFGAGVAAQIAAKYPEVREAYLKAFRAGYWTPGKVQYVRVGGQPQIIVNAASQDRYGRAGCFTVYPAIREIFTTVVGRCQDHNLTLACPMIGAGLAGGDWDTIREIIDEVSQNFVVNVYQLGR